MNRYSIIAAGSALGVVGLILFELHQSWRFEQRQASEVEQWNQQERRTKAGREEFNRHHAESLQLLEESSQQMNEINHLLTGAAELLAAKDQLLAGRDELLRLRREVARLEDMGVALSGLDPAATLTRWKRVHQLQARLEQTPAAIVPELALARAEDLFAACQRPLVTDIDYRQALSALRATLEGKLIAHLRGALRRYFDANTGQSPTNVEQLAPCFDPPVDPALLARWRTVPAEAGPAWTIISQVRVDREFDKIWAVTTNGLSSLDPQEHKHAR